MSGPATTLTGDDRITDEAPIFTTVTLAEQVYEHLRRGILTNRFPPGTAMPEEALATRLRVSRVPVREALRRLAAEGLVTVVARQRAVVSSLSPRRFLDAYQVREALEALAVRLATPKLTPEDVARLEALEDEMAEHVANGDVDAFFRVNAAFHQAIVELSGNANLQEIYGPLVRQMQRYYVPSLTLRGGMERSLEEHRAILDAMEAGDAEAAVRLMSEHIRVPQRALEDGGELQLVGSREAAGERRA